MVAIGEGLLSAKLPREAWTHEAHLAACSWLVCARGDIDTERELPLIIAAYNLAVGEVNDDTRGDHHTITQVYIAGVKAHLAEVSLVTFGAYDELAAITGMREGQPQLTPRLDEARKILNAIQRSK